MATDAPPTSIDWNSPSEEDIIKEQEEMTKYLEKPGTLEEFTEACKNIGQTAVAIDGDFKRVKTGFAKLVEKYGKDFPDVEKVYVPKWDRFMARWNGSTGILWSSRTLAANTAATLTDYGLNLGLVADIKTQDDLKGAQIELKDYVDKHPITVAKEVADGFKNLQSDIHDFSTDFTAYLAEQKQKLSDDAKKYEGLITDYEGQIVVLNKKIKTAAIILGCTFVFGILSAIPAGFLGEYVVERNKVQAQLDQAKSDLAGTIDKQVALAAMQVDFEKLKPDIDDICHKLGVFATIWAFAIEQSTEINTALDEGIKVLTYKKFQAKLNFLIAQIKPLREGMRIYAIQITPPETSSNVE
ncbi:hypothetical protein AGABI2DRAFT_179925 [Agaricus bisporus var. bisporus H97]|uniref:hypothetical protein n=1 Tax=Agaricus bisporus var. bisporus (strain H97 / ATCC MYA-4626 / FGSC 10389) TaxID=936046 RepID=UPI00029F6A13|nr:hypothetical protein AGABI2DRAFT_179925 [Agaricus bisporus var. bisporus H97]EKV44310.1 hypothetical protein AGABI2DRAFT_179925 [Agaricus bisporus var. bisporus H97]